MKIEASLGLFGWLEQWVERWLFRDGEDGLSGCFNGMRQVVWGVLIMVLVGCQREKTRGFGCGGYSFRIGEFF